MWQGGGTEHHAKDNAKEIELGGKACVFILAGERVGMRSGWCCPCRKAFILVPLCPGGGLILEISGQRLFRGGELGGIHRVGGFGVRHRFFKPGFTFGKGLGRVFQAGVSRVRAILENFANCLLFGIGREFLFQVADLLQHRTVRHLRHGMPVCLRPSQTTGVR